MAGIVYWYLGGYSIKKMVLLLAFVRSVGGVHPSREEASRCNGQELRLWSQTRTVQALFLPLPSCVTGSSYFRLRVSYLCLCDRSPPNAVA